MAAPGGRIGRVPVGGVAAATVWVAALTWATNSCASVWTLGRDPSGGLSGLGAVGTGVGCITTAAGTTAWAGATSGAASAAAAAAGRVDEGWVEESGWSAAGGAGRGSPDGAAEGANESTSTGSNGLDLPGKTCGISGVGLAGMAGADDGTSSSGFPAGTGVGAAGGRGGDRGRHAAARPRGSPREPVGPGISGSDRAAPATTASAVDRWR